LRNKHTELLRLIESTKDHIQQQEYLNELLKTGEEIQKAEDATSAFFSQMSPKFSNIINQTEEFFRLIEEAPQAFDNMRSSMAKMFGEYGEGIASLYGAMAGYIGSWRWLIGCYCWHFWSNCRFNGKSYIRRYFGWSFVHRSII